VVSDAVTITEGQPSWYELLSRGRVRRRWTAAHVVLRTVAPPGEPVYVAFGVLHVVLSIWPGSGPNFGELRVQIWPVG
jgi:hypothetical protein